MTFHFSSIANNRVRLHLASKASRQMLELCFLAQYESACCASITTSLLSTKHKKLHILGVITGKKYLLSKRGHKSQPYVDLYAFQQIAKMQFLNMSMYIDSLSYVQSAYTV